MSSHKSPRVRQEIVAEAVRWFIELNDDPQDRATREGFDRWLRRSPEHIHAYLQVSAQWEEYAPGPASAVESLEELIELGKTEPNVISLRDPALPGEEGGQKALTASRRQTPRWAIAVAVSVMLSFVAGVLVWRSFFLGVYRTGAGEQYAVTLTDGSTVELDAQTRIRVSFSRGERRVDVMEGQAFFRVTHDNSRPFIVESQDARVLAVGTQFDVYRTDKGTIVTVVEGRVAVASSRSHEVKPERPHENEESSEEVLLSAGEQVTVARLATTTAEQTRPRARSADVEAVTAWTQHRLIFKNAPLSQVVAEFNLHTRKPLIITDPTVAATQVSGSFSSSDPLALLNFLREVGACEIRETSASFEISHR